MSSVAAGTRASRRIYLDHAATTPVLPEVAAEVAAALAEGFGNPSSPHAEGRRARVLVERARRRVAALLGADPEEIVFTSGGTEADNLAVLGTARALRERGDHVVTTAIEHHAVLDACRALEAEGFRVTRVPVGASGIVDPDDVRRALSDRTVLVSVMLANNEIGTIQPVAEIARLARERGILVHTDAVQAVGLLPVDVRVLGVDLLSLSGHKLYAPKGAGALYVRRGARRFLRPLLFGGGQEGRLRPGTESVPAIVGLGAAAQLAMRDRATHAATLERWRDRLAARLLAEIPGARLNGDPELRLPNNVHVSIAGLDAEALLIALDLAGVAASSGAACSAGGLEPSHVLRALGRSDEEARSGLRLTLGRANVESDVDEAADRIVAAVAGLRARRLAPRGMAGLGTGSR